MTVRALAEHYPEIRMLPEETDIGVPTALQGRARPLPRRVRSYRLSNSGKAVARLTGGFQIQGETQVVNLKLSAPETPVDEVGAAAKP